MRGTGVDWQALRRELLTSAPRLEVLRQYLDGAAAGLLATAKHGHLERWLCAAAELEQLAQEYPAQEAESRLRLHQAAVQLGLAPRAAADRERAVQALQRLSPWRKGPFQVAGVHVDSEWRSNLKWERVAAAVDVRDRSVLDVGCGNGYYCYRALGAGARCAIGIDPSELYTVQFLATRHFAAAVPAWVLPLRLEDIDTPLACFDTVLSMGVLYHRPSPFEHLRDLRLALKPGGVLVLETLVIDGGPREVLVPAGRYAGMRNVYFLPSCTALQSWLRRAGFDDPQVADLAPTTPEEQRTTVWSPGQSLADALDPEREGYTVEGEPAPLRALVVARLRG